MFTLRIQNKRCKTIFIAAILLAGYSHKSLCMKNGSEEQLQGQLLALRQELGKPFVRLTELRHIQTMERTLENPSVEEIGKIRDKLVDQPEYSLQNLVSHFKTVAQQNSIDFEWNLTNLIAHASFATHVAALYSMQELLKQQEHQAYDRSETLVESYRARVIKLAEQKQKFREKAERERAIRIAEEKTLREKMIDQSRIATEENAKLRAQVSQASSLQQMIEDQEAEIQKLKQQLAKMAIKPSYALIARSAGKD